MNEQLQETLNKILTKALESAEATGEFLAGEIPEIIEQLLLWHLSLNIFNILFVAVLFTVFLTVTYKLYIKGKAIQKEANSHYLFADNELEPLFYVSSAIINTVTFLFLLYTLSTYPLKVIQILIAPKVWLLEYAARLVG